VTPQLIGLIVLAAVLLLLSILMWPASRELDGSQKYRRNRRLGPDLDPDTNKRCSVSVIQIALAALLGHSATTNASEDSDSGKGSDLSDVGDSGGGDGGGGD
jgi:hypothetical protein